MSSALAVAGGCFFIGFFIVRISRSKAQRGTCQCEDSLSQSSLRCPFFRINPQALHSLLRSSGISGVLKFPGPQKNIYGVYSHSACKAVLADTRNFYSNIFPGNRVVALSTMQQSDHDKCLRLIRAGYSKRRIEEMDETIRKIFFLHGGKDWNGDLVKWSKRVHMHISLSFSGLRPEKWGLEDGTSLEHVISDLEKFIRFNDVAVRLMAPLGGLGGLVNDCRKWEGPDHGRRYYNFDKGPLWSIMKSVKPTIRLMKQIGILETWKLLRPDLLFWSPDHVFDFPQLVPEIPDYFTELATSMETATKDSPAFNLWHGEISRSQAIAVAVQLMVNMTTANALLNLAENVHAEIGGKSAACDPSSCSHGISQEEKSKLIQRCLLKDCPLMRNPRRAVFDTELSGVRIPQGSLLILFIGAANEASEKDSLTFGHGLHSCLGRHLVLAEMHAAIDWMIEKRTWKFPVAEKSRLADIDVGNYGFERFELRV